MSSSADQAMSSRMGLSASCITNSPFVKLRKEMACRKAMTPETSAGSSKKRVCKSRDVRAAARDAVFGETLVRGTHWRSRHKTRTEGNSSHRFSQAQIDLRTYATSSRPASQKGDSHHGTDSRHHSQNQSIYPIPTSLFEAATPSQLSEGGMGGGRHDLAEHPRYKDGRSAKS